MNKQRILPSTYLDIIFEGRNKNYGGYQLRLSYPERMYKSGVFIIIFTLLLSAYTLWANREIPLPSLPFISQEDTLVFIKPDILFPEKVIDLPKTQAGKSDISTKKLSIPDIVENEIVKLDDQLVKQADLKNAVAGNTNTDGQFVGDGSSAGDGGKLGGDGTANLNSGGGISTNKVLDFVEQNPEYPGGMMQLYAFLASELKYPQLARQAGEEGKVRVRFVVNEDGQISNIEIVKGFGFGSEEEAIRVLKLMPKWTPGRNNGKAVKSWFYLPIAFSLK